jgi:hypothetical protein
MFKIMDTEKLFIPVKSGFPTAAKAYDWAKKNLPKDSCRPWRLWTPTDRSKKYFIQKY